MYVLCSQLILMIIINGLCTDVLMSRSTNNNNNNNRIDPIVRNLKHIVDSALQQDTSDDINNELLIEELSRILEREEGFRLNDRQQRSIHPIDEDQTRIFDGSGDDISEDKDLPPLYSNMTLVTITMGSTTTAFAKYTPQSYTPCPCEKGDRGEKGDLGICPTNCGQKFETYTKECLGSRINLERLAEALGQLILDAKKIAFRNAQGISCVCPTSPPPLPSTTTVATQFTLDYNTYIRFKGEKGDRGEIGTSCSPACMQSTQLSLRVFTTLQQAITASPTYPDHTYVHIVNEYGRLQGVYVRVRGQLIPIRLGNEYPVVVSEPTIPPTTIGIPSTQCRTTLPCPTLHMFAIGPHVRRSCNMNRGAAICSRLADYDHLCATISGRGNLKGHYRAFMSASTQWLSNLFAGICVNAKIVNTKEQILFDSVGDMFEQKPPQSEILDAQGIKPEFQYWWHGTSANGSASRETCHDWSRQDSSLSGMASRMPDGLNGLFHHQYIWPCSIGDSNMGILCIETNCDRNKKL
ncbi:hypothetical protein I4U23_013686 [Adineta vaga]|nr:hypothetical protein I4U23_013686 [Adineta vaga]